MPWLRGDVGRIQPEAACRSDVVMRSSGHAGPLSPPSPAPTRSQPLPPSARCRQRRRSSGASGAEAVDLTNILDQAGIPWRVFSDTVADPTTAVVEAGTRRLAEDGYHSLVAIGGGSSIESAPCRTSAFDQLIWPGGW